MTGATDWSLAIDLGTTNTVAAVRVGAAPPESLALSTDGAGLPSSVFLSGSTVYTGDAAVDHAAEDPASFYPSPKRLLMQMTEATLDDLRPVFSALYREVYRRASGRHGPVPPTRVVLTCPAALSDRARAMLTAAAGDSGIDETVIDIVPEPVAAVAWYCRDVSVPDRLLIVDVGGGTCDTALVRFDSSGAPVLISTAGDNGLGGRTLDHCFAQAIAARLDGGSPEPETLAVLGEPGAYRIVERGRESLSTQQSCAVDLREQFGEDGGTHWSRAEFEETVSGEMDRIGVLVRRALAASGDHGLRPEICMTGGAALTPAVQRQVAECGVLRPVEAPFTAVALGALLTGEPERPASPGERPAPQEAGQAVAGPRGVRRSTLVRGVVAAVCALALVAGGVFIATQRDGGGDGVGGAADSNRADGADSAEAADSFDPSPVTPVAIPGDSPLLQSGDLSCHELVDPAVAALQEVMEVSNPPNASGFNGITRCTLGAQDGGVSLVTFRPHGFRDFELSRDTTSYGTATPVGEDLPGWYRLRQEDESLPDDQVFLYVRGKGWLVVTATTQEALDTDAAVEVARGLSLEVEVL